MLTITKKMVLNKFFVIPIIIFADFLYFSQFKSEEFHNFHSDYSMLDSNLSKESLPIVYRDEYNIRLMGIEKFHPFDTEKYLHITEFLIKEKILTFDQFLKPKIVSEEQLKLVHTEKYLQSLEEKTNIVRIAETEALSLLPNFILKNNMIQPLKYATGGTILSSQLAIQYGWSINLGGGFHHAHSSDGGGWCYFDDIMISIKLLPKKIQKVLIIDLDAHQGNGIERDKLKFKNDNIFIFDMYNGRAYPFDSFAKKAIDYKIELLPKTTDGIYLEKLKDGLNHIKSSFQPDIIFYNAGSDILKGDPLGGLNISPNAFIEKDELVFSYALENKIPIVYLLSGGYQKTNAKVISDSIVNLFKKKIIN